MFSVAVDGGGCGCRVVGCGSFGQVCTRVGVSASRGWEERTALDVDFCSKVFLTRSPGRRRQVNAELREQTRQVIGADSITQEFD